MKKICFKVIAYCFILGVLLVCFPSEKISNNLTQDLELDKIVYQNMGVGIVEENKKEVLTQINKDNTTKVIAFYFCDDKQFNFQPTIKDKKNIKAIKEELRVYRQTVKEYYSSFNNRLIEKLGISHFNLSMTVSNYTPFVFMRSDAITTTLMNSLISISKNEEIQRIYIYDKIEPKVELSQTIDALMNDYSINSLYNGSGITIGFVEPSVLDKDNINFVGRNVTIAPGSGFTNYLNDSHAIRVAAVAAGNYGIARGANILAVQQIGDLSEEFEWLLNNNVDIINASFGYIPNYGEYDSNALYIDRIVNVYKVLFVGSAGNEGQTHGYITTPKTAYNCLTVGCCDLQGNIDDQSSVHEAFPISKPNLVAAAMNMTIPGYSERDWSGTSYSAAFVSGVAAIMMQNDGTFLYRPESVISVLSATTNMIKETHIEGCGLDEASGAGMMNIDRLFNNMDNYYNYQVTSAYEDDSIIASRTIYLNQGECLKACLTFLKTINDEENNILLSDFDVVLRYNNTLVDAGNSDYSNVEYIEYVAPESGYYTIQLVKFTQTSLDAVDNLSLAYSIIENE